MKARLRRLKARLRRWFWIDLWRLAQCIIPHKFMVKYYRIYRILGYDVYQFNPEEQERMRRYGEYLREAGLISEKYAERKFGARKKEV